MNEKERLKCIDNIIDGNLDIISEDFDCDKNELRGLLCEISHISDGSCLETDHPLCKNCQSKLRDEVENLLSSDESSKITVNNIAEHKAICDYLNDQYEAKNKDYGDSFSKSVKKYGLIAALTRISDKFNRIENLVLNKDRKVADEKLNDTLLDLANYCIMTVIEIENGVR